MLTTPIKVLCIIFYLTKFLTGGGVCHAWDREHCVPRAGFTHHYRLEFLAAGLQIVWLNRP
jgi:hypothetical protein